MTQPNREQPNQSTDQELRRIDALLRNDEFARAMAEAQHRADEDNENKNPAPLLVPDDETACVTISRRDEKIATNLAGFYALECGLGAVCAQTNQKPTDLLQAIVNDQVDSDTVLLLNRFANATWKAGQPFRGFDRIKRPVFTVASFLPNEEARKDYDQIRATSGALLTAMQDVRDQSTDEQMKTLRHLLQSESFAVAMAATLDAAYYLAQQQAAPPFLTLDDEETTVTKSANEQKIAIHLAGFYALECGLTYWVTTRQTRPSDLLNAVVGDLIAEADKELLCRFANATWKAGQPFQGLHRITRNTFTPFYFLTEADREKDWKQIQTAAGLMLERL